MYTYAHISFLLKDEIFDIKFFSNIESLHKFLLFFPLPPFYFLNYLILKPLAGALAGGWG